MTAAPTDAARQAAAATSVARHGAAGSAAGRQVAAPRGAPPTPAASARQASSVAVWCWYAQHGVRCTRDASLTTPTTRAMLNRAPWGKLEPTPPPRCWTRPCARAAAGRLLGVCSLGAATLRGSRPRGGSPSMRCLSTPADRDPRSAPQHGPPVGASVRLVHVLAPISHFGAAARPSTPLRASASLMNSRTYLAAERVRERCAARGR